MTETEREALIRWLSDKIVKAHERVGKLRAARSGTSAVDAAQRDLDRLQDLRSRVGRAEYPAIDEARTMKVDEQDASS